VTGVASLLGGGVAYVLSFIALVSVSPGGLVEELVVAAVMAVPWMILWLIVGSFARRFGDRALSVPRFASITTLGLLVGACISALIEPGVWPEGASIIAGPWLSAGMSFGVSIKNGAPAAILPIAGACVGAAIATYRRPLPVAGA
jgi:hypothetical protein